MGAQFYKYTFEKVESSSFIKDGDWILIRKRNGVKQAHFLFEKEVKDFIDKAKKSKNWFDVDDDGKFQVCHYDDGECDFCEWIKIMEIK